RGGGCRSLGQPLWHGFWWGDAGVPRGAPSVFRDGADRLPVWLRDDGRPARARRGERAGRPGALCHGFVSARPAAIHGLQSGGGGGDPAPGIHGPGADPALGGGVAACGPLDDDATIQVVTETTGGAVLGSGREKYQCRRRETRLSRVPRASRQGTFFAIERFQAFLSPCHSQDDASCSWDPISPAVCL